MYVCTATMLISVVSMLAISLSPVLRSNMNMNMNIWVHAVLAMRNQ